MVILIYFRRKGNRKKINSLTINEFENLATLCRLITKILLYISYNDKVTGIVMDSYRSIQTPGQLRPPNSDPPNSHPPTETLPIQTPPDSDPSPIQTPYSDPSQFRPSKFRPLDNSDLLHNSDPWAIQTKAFYRQGQRQPFQPHFTCGRLVALQCIVSTIRYLFFLTLHVESIATTPLDTINIIRMNIS